MIFEPKNQHLVIGAGAVGLALTTFIQNSGMRVALLARGATADAIRRNGIQRTGTLGSSRINADAVEVIDDLKWLKKPVDTVFICTKAFDTIAVVEQINEAKHATDKDTKFIICQNGWGGADLIASHFGKHRVLNSRIMTGIVRRGSDIEITVHAQPWRIGSLYDRSTSVSECICEVLRRGGLPAEATSMIEQDLWAKMLFNCIVNPLGAIFKVPIGTLVNCPEMRIIIDRIVAEIFDVMVVAGYQTYWHNASEYLDFFYSELMPLTRSHFSSMHQDIQGGARTEIDALNGAIVRIGDHFGICVEQNRMVYQLIRFAESIAIGSQSAVLQVA